VVWKMLPRPARRAEVPQPSEAADLEARIRGDDEAGAAASGTHRMREVWRDKQIVLVTCIY